MSSAYVTHFHNNSIIQVLTAQQTRNENVSSLADQMADMLAFLNEVEPLKKIKLLEVTVASMMKQIEECGIFITKFVGDGFFSTRSIICLAILKSHSLHSADSDQFLFFGG